MDVYTKVKESSLKAAKGLWTSFPMIVGTVLLISLISTIIPPTFYTKLFSGRIIVDSFIGSFIGSISAGHPMTSYIFGGEILQQGVSLLVVTAFLVSWVTVGLIQLPAESTILGKKFAILRNITAFMLAIFVAIIVSLIMEVIV